MNKDIYNDHMDREIVSLCDALNSLPGVHTSESCGGHDIHQAEIFFFICLKAKCRNCPKKLGEAFAKATEEMEKRYEKAIVFWQRTHGCRVSKKARR